MNDSNKNNTTPAELDQLILDRLVDNDLSDKEYREVLRLVEEKPNGWRSLALAFLESQAFEKELTALNHFPDVVDDQESGSECSSGLMALPPSSASAPKVATQNRTQKSPENNRGVGQFSHAQDQGFWRSFRNALPALAACLAIAFAVGLYVREIQNRNQLKTVDSGNVVNSGGDPGFIELVSNDPGGRVQTPVFNHESFDAGDYAQEIKALKPRLQEVVNRPGWNANERTHMVPIKDKTGNKIIVPLNEIKLTPTSFEKYQ